MSSNPNEKESFLDVFNKVGKALSDQSIRLYAAEVDKKLIELPMEDRIGIINSIIKHSEVDTDLISDGKYTFGWYKSNILSK